MARKVAFLTLKQLALAERVKIKQDIKSKGPLPYMINTIQSVLSYSWPGDAYILISNTLLCYMFFSQLWMRSLLLLFFKPPDIFHNEAGAWKQTNYCLLIWSTIKTYHCKLAWQSHLNFTINYIEIMLVPN